MGRTKEKKKIIHEPSTHEIYVCLSGAQGYCRLLMENKTDKPYINFLAWLLEIDFHNDVNEKISIKKLAAEFKTDSAKATKWIREIYEDIFTLNDEKPHLFQEVGIKVELYFKHYDSYCCFRLSMPVLPREFERLNFYFVKGEIGVDYFWVKKVEHNLNAKESEVTIWLEGGTINKYREFALDKALFHNWIGFMDVYEKQSFELDELIQRFTSSNQSNKIPAYNPHRYYH